MKEVTMPDLKLGKLPDRTPVRITISLTPDLHRALQAYAELYRESYGRAEPVPTLIPYMLESFLATDRGYAKARKLRPADAPQLDLGLSPRRAGRRRRADSSEPSAAQN